MNIELESFENTLGEGLESRNNNWRKINAIGKEQLRQSKRLDNGKLTDTITEINGKTGVITKEDIMALGIGEKGEVGPKGLPGEKGEKGERGPSGNPENLALLEEVVSDLEAFVLSEINRLEQLIAKINDNKE